MTVPTFAAIFLPSCKVLLVHSVVFAKPDHGSMAQN